MFTPHERASLLPMQGFGGEVDRFAVQGEGGIVRKAAEVADGKEEFGAVGAEPFETFGTELFGQDEMAGKVDSRFVDREIIDAALQGARVDVAFDVQLFGQDVYVGGSAVAGNEEHGACEGLPSAPLFAHFDVGSLLGVAALVHHVHDDGLRNEQQQADDNDEGKFDSQAEVVAVACAREGVGAIVLLHDCCFLRVIICFVTIQKNFEVQSMRVKKKSG